MRRPLCSLARACERVLGWRPRLTHIVHSHCAWRVGAVLVPVGSPDQITAQYSSLFNSSFTPEYGV